MEISLETLSYFKERYGEDFLFTSSNCNNNPSKPGDYVFVYGKVGELINRIKKGEIFHLV